MPISGVVSIPSAVGSSTVLTVNGAENLSYARLLQSYLDTAISDGTLNLVQGQSQAGSTDIQFSAAIAGSVNEAVVSADQSAGIGIGGTAYLPAGYQALFDNVNGASTVIGSDTGVDGIFAGIGSAATYIDNGGNNIINFVDGNNIYLGDTLTSATADVIMGGSGSDTIDTGAGQSTVYAGVGRSFITLNDVTPLGTRDDNTGFNGYVYLETGQSTVNANGAFDAVIASQPGQVIYGGDSAADYTAVVLVPGGSEAGNDLIYGSAATVSVFDASSGNSVIGGTGLLQFMGGPGVSALINTASGINHVFGSAGDTINWASDNASGTNIFVAGLGNETLNGGNAQASLQIFGYADSIAADNAQVNESLIGGSGNDTLVSGAGNETLTGGAGHNVFVIAEHPAGGDSHITISDFNASSDLITFANYTQAEIDSALGGAHTVLGAAGQTDISFTLSDNTEVTVLGLSSLTGHTYTG